MVERATDVSLGLLSTWPPSDTTHSRSVILATTLQCHFSSLILLYHSRLCSAYTKSFRLFVGSHKINIVFWLKADHRRHFHKKLSRICSFIDIYWAGSLTAGITLILFTQAIAQLKDIYRELIATISINPGLLQDVFLVDCEVQEFWVSQKISRRLC